MIMLTFSKSRFNMRRDTNVFSKHKELTLGFILKPLFWNEIKRFKLFHLCNILEDQHFDRQIFSFSICRKRINFGAFSAVVVIK